jgi:hypoxanthine phosphoribosyltransferase
MKIKDLNFKKFIKEEAIFSRIAELANQINKDYKNMEPIFLPILNGSFLFAADLMREIKIQNRISFVKVSSYEGTQSSGALKTLIGLQESIFNKDLIIIEDIIDTGTTIEQITNEMKERGAKTVEVVSLLRKEIAKEKNINPKYLGFDIPDAFVVGYGLDYDGYGRNLKDIYQVAE